MVPQSAAWKFPRLARWIWLWVSVLPALVRNTAWQGWGIDIDIDIYISCLVLKHPVGL